MTLLLIYSIAEVALALHITLSNFVVLYVYVRTRLVPTGLRSVRTVTNTYIFSLALTDFLSGVIVWSVITRQPTTYFACLSIHLLLCILCTISTFHMLSIALDKYVTICCKDKLFSTRRKRACILISASWTAGTAIAVVPLFEAFGMSKEEQWYGECHFTVVMDYKYLVYIIFCSTILIPSLIIIYCYIRIYHTIRQEEKEVTFMLNRNEKERRMASRRKLIRTLLILVFTYPLYLLNTWDFLMPKPSGPLLTLSAVVLSHVSCAVNPLIYAYGMPGFKKALRIFLRGYISKDFCIPISAQSTHGTLTGAISRDMRKPSRLSAYDAMRKSSAPPVARCIQPRNAARRRTVDVYF